MTTTRKVPTARELARAFAGVLTSWLTPAEMAEVNRLNAASRDRMVCHSHDYCDANQAMLDAAESLGFDLDVGPDTDWTLTNDAWDIAKAHGFSVAQIDGEAA